MKTMVYPKEEFLTKIYGEFGKSSWRIVDLMKIFPLLKYDAVETRVMRYYKKYKLLARRRNSRYMLSQKAVDKINYYNR